MQTRALLRIRYLAARAAGMAVLLVGVSVLLFAIMHAAPGGPEAMLVGETFDPAVAESLRRQYGLDDPVPVQYVRWAAGALRGDFGRSFRDGQPVMLHIRERLGPTLQLTAGGLLLAVLAAVPLGVAAAARRGRATDHLASAAMIIGVSFPSFWLGILLILGFSSLLGWLPAAGIAPYGLEGDLLERVRYAVLPTVTLAVTQFAALARFTRSSMLDALGRDYVRTAEAKGAGRGAVLYRHALRNGLIPVVTAVGLSLPALLGGAVLTETVFSWPGLGRLAVDAILERDYPVIMAIELIVAAAVVLANFLTDVVYTLVDPRITLE
ncbi:MAG TPA: ABC transporter permease [Thermodesulfobacteriota bacterium]